MKTMKKLIYLILAVVFALACEDPEPDPFNPGPKGPVDGSYLEATIQLQRTNITAIDFVPEQIISVRYSGSGESNMMGSVRFESNHEEQIQDQRVVSKVDLGQFTLKGEGTSDAIFGNYEGQGSNWTLEISGGSGKFVSAKGTLYVTLQQNDSDQFPIAKIRGLVITDVI